MAKALARTRKTQRSSVLPVEIVERRIYVIRGTKVMLDSSLAELYEVSTGNLNLAVKRNIARFPADFMFQLTRKEAASLVLQSAIPNVRGGRRTLPYAFTQEGIAMLAAVLNSPKAIQVSIAIMQAFVKLREMLATHADLAKKIEDLELKFTSHDEELRTVFDSLRQLLEPPERPKRQIGFPSSK